MKKPDECKSIDDIRKAIDKIDKDIILLLAQRASYVYEAAKYKTSIESVQDEDRVKKMLIKRREWAQQNNINPDFIENLYQSIVDFFINEEMAKWGKKP